MSVLYRFVWLIASEVFKYTTHSGCVFKMNIQEVVGSYLDLDQPEQ